MRQASCRCSTSIDLQLCNLRHWFEIQIRVVPEAPAAFGMLD